MMLQLLSLAPRCFHRTQTTSWSFTEYSFRSSCSSKIF